jgi:hypothetical protein
MATTPLFWFGKKPEVLLTSTTAEPEKTNVSLSGGNRAIG